MPPGEHTKHAWYLRNKPRPRKKARKWRYKNRAKLRVYHRGWTKRNLKSVRKYYQRYCGPRKFHSLLSAVPGYY